MKKKIKCFLFLSFVLLACELQASKSKLATFKNNLSNEIKDIAFCSYWVPSNFNTSLLMLASIKSCSFAKKQIDKIPYIKELKKLQSLRNQYSAECIHKILDMFHLHCQIASLRLKYNDRKTVVDKCSTINQSVKCEILKKLQDIKDNIDKLEKLETSTKKDFLSQGYKLSNPLLEKQPIVNYKDNHTFYPEEIQTLNDSIISDFKSLDKKIKKNLSSQFSITSIVTYTTKGGEFWKKYKSKMKDLSTNTDKELSIKELRIIKAYTHFNHYGYRLFGLLIGGTASYYILPFFASYAPKIWLLTTTTGFSAYYINTFIGFNKKQATAIITLACIILASIYTIWNESLPKVMQHPQAANLTKSRIDKLEKETGKRP